MTPEKLKEVIDCVFNNTQSKLKTSKRFLTLMAYCSDIDNLRDYSTDFINICHNKDCSNCREYESIFREEMNKQIEKDFKGERDNLI